MWLNRILDSMQSTIRHEMTEAVVSYEEKPRDQWLFEPPAQVGGGGGTRRDWIEVGKKKRNLEQN